MSGAGAHAIGKRSVNTTDYTSVNTTEDQHKRLKRAPLVFGLGFAAMKYALDIVKDELITGQKAKLELESLEKAISKIQNCSNHEFVLLEIPELQEEVNHRRKRSTMSRDKRNVVPIQFLKLGVSLGLMGNYFIFTNFLLFSYVRNW